MSEMMVRPAELEQRARLARRRKYWGEALTGILFLLPATVIIVLFHFTPVFYAFYISLFRWALLPEKFIGLENYATVLSSQGFWNSLLVTFYFVLGTVPLALAISFFVAYLLFQKIIARSFFRTVYFLPYITSIVAAAMVWRWIYHPQGGAANYFFNLLGLPMQQWLLEPTGIFKLLLGGAGITIPEWAGGPSLALVAVMLMTIWQSAGFDIVIMLAGLGNIPGELYEAARIDGAKERHLLRHITLPLLSPTLFFLGIITTIRAFQAFNQIYIMTNGGPVDTTRTVTMYIFSNFYEYTRVGYASAVAFVLFFVILGLTIIQIRVVGQRVHY
ncbi:MAG: sugar ABC transporter permease [Chloroflexi bacterium]|nr:sugar ABC transporter permease [Chloroflexota bacterium]